MNNLQNQKIKSISDNEFNLYSNSNFVMSKKTNGFFINFYTQKQIIVVIKDNVLNQVKKHLIKRNIEIQKETSKIYNKEHKTKVNILLLKYETQSNKLSACFLLKKYGLKEREKRKDLNLHAIIYGK